MSGIRLNGRAYGGVATVANADHLMCEDGSGNIINAQTMIQNILGNMASIEQSDTASKAYAVGDYLVLNGYLYKVTVAIAADGTITPGTNVVKTTIGEELDKKHDAILLSSAFDMNNITESGIYYANVSTNNITNWPASDGWLFFSVHNDGSTNNLVQIIYGGRTDSLAGRVSYVRYRTNSTWRSWISLGSGNLLIQGITTISKTVPGDSGADLNTSVAKTGYTPIGVVGWQSFSGGLFLYNCRVDQSNSMLYCSVRNVSSSAVTGAMSIIILYQKN